MNSQPAGRPAPNKVQELLSQGLREVAREVAEDNLARQPNDPSALLLMAKVMQEFADFYEVGRLCEIALAQQPRNPDVLAFASLNWFRAGEHQTAFDLLRRLEAVAPHTREIRLEQARVVLRLSGADAAERILESVPRDEDIMPLRNLIEGLIWVSRREAGKAEECLLMAAQSTGLALHMRSYAWFELAKTHDRAGNYDAAWESATSGHQLLAKRFDTDGYEAQLASIRKIFDKRQSRQWAHATKPDDRHVFIVGMPRSGTTLLEQILSMHPKAANAGELSISLQMQRRVATLTDSFLPWPKSIVDLREQDADVLQAMYQASVSKYGDAKSRITNKSLVLQSHLGLLMLALPGSRSIMLHRHPLDNMVSCYTTDLVGSGHHYCSDLNELAAVWVSRRKMQDFWAEHLEQPPMELHYERLVADQEGQTRALLAHLDLPWEEACLSFHKSTRKVTTISHDQVTRKMYDSSKGRWRNYEKFLAPVMDVVKDYI